MTRVRHVNYGQLAAWLRLPLRATCDDLCQRLAAYEYTDAEYRGRLLHAVLALPPSAEWFCGLRALSRVLQEDNPRFQSGLFEEACVEHL